MLYTILNFGWILCSTFLLGFVITDIFGKYTGKNILSLDYILISGLMVATVYAEIFSLVYKVRTLAMAVLLLGNLAIILWGHRKIYDYIKCLIRSRNFWPKTIVVFCLALIGVMVACQEPNFYDTGLYHAQAIHWIENYGCVKGLGNLHNRFAYNSSFLCLQALYSWSAILGQSLHGMNAYIAVIMAGYSILSFRFFKRKEETIADAFNLFLLLYIGSSIADISSPNTDFLAMTLMLYIFSRWFRSSSIQEKCFLCILAVFGVTVKLSIASLVMIVILPAIDLIRKKQWKIIGICLLFGGIVVLPFLIRNVMISGYLIYPYSEIDLFQVDWKMPAYTATFDRNEIMAWGKAIKNAYQYDLGIKEWFPLWYGQMDAQHRCLVIVNGGLIILLLSYIMIMAIRRKMKEWMLVYLVALLGVGMWFFSAPLLRYGIAYLYLSPAFIVGIIFKNLNINKLWYVCLGIVSASVLINVFLNTGRYMKDCETVPIVYPKDYISYPYYECEIGNEISVYLPNEGDRSGYEPFPSIPYLQRLEVIELRGESLKDGFRMKDEYRAGKVNTYGNVDD